MGHQRLLMEIWAASTFLFVMMTLWVILIGRLQVGIHRIGSTLQLARSTRKTYSGEARLTISWKVFCQLLSEQCLTQSFLFFRVKSKVGTLEVSKLSLPSNLCCSFFWQYDMAASRTASNFTTGAYDAFRHFKISLTHNTQVQFSCGHETYS